MIKIGVDAMGGDFAPLITVEGAMQAVKMFHDIEITLFGDENQIKPLLKNDERIKIVHTDSYIDMGEKDPIKQIRNNRQSSLVLAFKAAKDKEVDAVVSSGPTQALVVGAHLILKRMDKMKRVALAPIIPSKDGKGRILLDVGANVELRPEHLLELAVFASVTSKEILGVENPVVGLLNIGSEPGKGREVDKETFTLLSNEPHINFYGNVEPKEILTTDCNVLITDGFTGNMILKTIEGTAKGTGEMLKEEIKGSFLGKIGYLLMKKNLQNYKKRLDASEIGGAMIFGVSAPVIKAHGSSNSYAFYNAIRQARVMVKSDLIKKVSENLPDIKTSEEGEE